MNTPPRVWSVFKSLGKIGLKLFIQRLGAIEKGFPVHTQPAGRQNRNIISITLTSLLVACSFYDKILFS